MYQHYERNKLNSKSLGYSWPYNTQSNYQSYLYPYTTYPNQTMPNFYPNQFYYQQPFPTNSPSTFSPYPTPYPIGAMPQQQSVGFQSVLSQFKKKDGTYDINKLMDTAGQMMGTVNQVSSIVKGLTKTFKV